MSYTALYRKFRPDSFEQVKGQDHIVTTLKNQIKFKRVGHAYLFCGTRGTGKTTLAKILAKAVNCENPVEGNPCNACAMCRAINRQTSMNVIEIDAASNNGVDNVREIINEVRYSPTEGKYKVYIIDEVHMLSSGAYNALLKTLEEPPEYVIFILATTEAHSIPVTIMSRCQRYDFHRIDINTITSRLKELTDIEGIKVEEKALRYVAKAADGSMRDALSLLDQCIAYHFGEILSYDKVLEVLGAVDMDIFDKIFHGIQKKDVTRLLELVEEVIVSGKELGRLVTEYTWFLRNILMLKASDEAEDMVEATKEDMEMLKNDAKLITFLDLIRDIQIFSELSNKIKYAVQKRALLEVALVRMCIPQMDTDVESLHARVRELERRLEQGAAVKAFGVQNPAEGLNAGRGDGLNSGSLSGGDSRDAGGLSAVGGSDDGNAYKALADGNMDAAGRAGDFSGAVNQDGSFNLTTDNFAGKNPSEYNDALPEEIKALCTDWGQVIRYRLEPALRSCAEYAVLEPDKAGGNHIILKTEYKLTFEVLKESKDKIQKVLEDYIQKKVEFDIVYLEENAVPEKKSAKDRLKEIQSKVNLPVDIL